LAEWEEEVSEPLGIIPFTSAKIFLDASAQSLLSIQVVGKIRAVEEPAVIQPRAI
jgi:hypothetical protein